MKHEAILSNVARHISLDESEREYFISILTSKDLRKKECLLKAGQPCNTLYYVQSGALRAFHQNGQGNEVTIMFAVADWWITDMPCFINHQVAMTSIEAIDDSCVLLLTKTALDTLYIKVPKFERYFRILMQNAYVREQLRTLQNLSHPAEERYTHFLAKYPDIAKRLAQRQIASFLGITPEFLSAIRKKISRGSIS